MTVRAAGALVGLQGCLGVIFAVVLLVRAVLGADQSVASGFGLAVLFAILGGGLAAAGGALILGQQWGRGIAFVSQILLVPVVWTLLTGSHQVFYGALLGVAVVGSLVLLLLPPSTRWASQTY